MTDLNVILARITKELPRNLFAVAREEWDGAYFEASRRAGEVNRYDSPERREVLGRERHWCSERALRRAGEAAAVSVATRDTIPTGGRYALLVSPSFVIGRAKLDRYRGNVKQVKYRRQLATMNAAVSHLQDDLFLARMRVRDDRLFGLFLSGVHPKQPDVPAFLNFAIPNHDLSGWVFNEPVENVIAAYAEVERPVERIPDLIRVVLKKPAS
ncbi:MAG: hypothetical protein C3F11_09535 [Methylocystaceae bacterium]|nr:MAG: hypothetical protein C3F11_09535 [Methylocystaceae bacterium]